LYAKVEPEGLPVARATVVTPGYAIPENPHYQPPGYPAPGAEGATFVTMPAPPAVAVAGGYGAPAAVPYPVGGSGAMAIPVAYAHAGGAPSGELLPGQPGHLPRSGVWSDGICDCFNHFESCLVAACIMPLRWAKTVERARMMTWARALLLYGLPWIALFIFTYVNYSWSAQYEYDPNYPYTRRRRSGMLGWAVALAAIANIVMIVLGTVYRGKIRAMFHIPGSGCEDCLLHTFCRLCAVTQESRQVDRDTGFIL